MAGATDIFLTLVDDRQRWYCFHGLFRQSLHVCLEQMHSPTEIAALHLRAARGMLRTATWMPALQHAVAAGDIAAAAQIVAQHRHALMNHSQWQRLEHWIHLFPRAVIDENPDLLLGEVALKVVRQQISEMPALLDRVEALLARELV